MNYEDELFDAVLDGDIEMTKELIGRGAIIHVFMSIGEQANLKSIKFLLDQGLDVNAIDPYGWFKLLLSNGADKIIDHENLEGVSALRMAFISKPSLSFDGIKLLLEHGASPDKENANGKTVRERLKSI